MSRGTTNRNDRGSTRDRRRRREWLVETFRADVDAYEAILDGSPIRYRTYAVPRGQGVPACRCYRCGVLLTADTVSPDRIIPGCEGGTYRRGNIRPACARCQSCEGGLLGAARRKARRVAA